MLVDLVQVTTSDSVRLHGALELPDESARVSSQGSPPIDVWLLIHGTGSNFYAGKMLAGLAPQLLAGGSAVLRANTRGHDVICTGPATGPTWLGAAFERVSDAPLDLLPWIEFLRERGFKRIGLVGHSLGAVKAIYTLAAPGAPQVAALVASSPPRLSYEYLASSPRGEEFRAAFAHAESLVREERGTELMLARIPLYYYVSAAAYVDRYGPPDRYNVLNVADRVRVPTLCTFGTIELQEMAFRGLPEALEASRTSANQLQTAIIAGADHQYTGCYDALGGRIMSWASRLGGYHAA